MGPQSVFTRIAREGHIIAVDRITGSAGDCGGGYLCAICTTCKGALTEASPMSSGKCTSCGTIEPYITMYGKECKNCGTVSPDRGNCRCEYCYTTYGYTRLLSYYKDGVVVPRNNTETCPTCHGTGQENVSCGHRRSEWTTLLLHT